MPLHHHWPPGKILPIQELLPEHPKVSDLPKLPGKITGQFTCPGLLYCLWKSGRHAAMVTACNRWSCGRCAKIKIDEITQVFADATVDSPMVYDALFEQHELNKVLKLFRKKEISALSLKLPNETYILASDHAEARTWTMTPLTRASAIAKLQTVDTTRIRRRDFINNWRPEALYEPKKDTVVFSTVFANMDDLKEIISDYGLDINSEFIPGDPLDAVERLTKLRKDHTIVFDNVEYLVE